MLEIWTVLGVWIRCDKGFSPPDFVNIDRLDDLTKEPGLSFYVVSNIPYERIQKMQNEAKDEHMYDYEKALNEEEVQAVEKVSHLLEKVPGVRVLQVATLHGGCSSYGDMRKNGGIESGWDFSKPIQTHCVSLAKAQSDVEPIKLKEKRN